MLTCLIMGKMSSGLFASSLLGPTSYDATFLGEILHSRFPISPTYAGGLRQASLYKPPRVAYHPTPPLRSEQPRRKRRLNSGLPGGAPLGVGNLGRCTFGQHYWYDTTNSYLLVSPRWPLTGIIYQLYAPDLGIQSWICINRSGRSWQAFYLSISIINRIHITKPGHK